MAIQSDYYRRYQALTLPILQALGLDQASLGDGFILVETDTNSVTIEWTQLIHTDQGMFKHPMRSTITVTNEVL